MKKLPTPKARELLAKLEALAERGVNGERDNAIKKLRILRQRYDFTKANAGGTDIFKGVFITSPGPAAPIIAFDSADFDIANAVKWAIETETHIPCLYRSGQLCAQAAPSTANRLHEIAATVYGSFVKLWAQFKASPQVNPADRGNFILGLYEGMMNEERTNEALPGRAHVDKVKRARKRDVAAVPGLAVHPYAVAVKLGRQIRFCVPFADIAGELDKTIRGELKA